MLKNTDFISNQLLIYSVSQIGEVHNQKAIAIWSKSLGVLHLSEKRYIQVFDLFRRCSIIKEAG